MLQQLQSIICVYVFYRFISTVFRASALKSLNHSQKTLGHIMKTIISRYNAKFVCVYLILLSDGHDSTRRGILALRQYGMIPSQSF